MYGHAALKIYAAVRFARTLTRPHSPTVHIRQIHQRIHKIVFVSISEYCNVLSHMWQDEERPSPSDRELNDQRDVGVASFPARQQNLITKNLVTHSARAGMSTTLYTCIRVYVRTYATLPQSFRFKLYDARQLLAPSDAQRSRSAAPQPRVRTAVESVLDRRFLLPLRRVRFSRPCARHFASHLC